jgi:hypothetical protein
LTEDTSKAEPVRGKILKFPVPIADKHTAVAAAAGSAGTSTAVTSTVPSTSSASSASSSPSAFQRLAAVRRRRTDRVEAETEATPAKAPSTRPTVSQLVTWLLNLRKGGVGYLYWNAAKLPIEVALVRAARLEEEAIVDVVGHRILVVEPLRPRPALPTTTEAPEAVLP